MLQRSTSVASESKNPNGEGPSVRSWSHRDAIRTNGVLAGEECAPRRNRCGEASRTNRCARYKSPHKDRLPAGRACVMDILNDRYASHQNPSHHGSVFQGS